jgi:ABC-type polysaccharide/polyol phosphate transport system ATPase subunit
MTIAIAARGLSKQFSAKYSRNGLRRSIDRVMLAPLQPALFPAPAQFSDQNRWALRDVSFEITHGECVALVGHNGAGKSVLLRVLARITRPNVGEAELHGRVGAVLDVGIGFNRELTGMENIFLQGAILGIRKQDLAKKLDAIVALSGMQEFLHYPLKAYSNGMQVRLAFAVAAQLEPEILLMDEVLAVADEEFINTCVQRLKELNREGRTIVLASHDTALLERVCARVIWLEQGRVVGDGPIREILEQYHARVANKV